MTTPTLLAAFVRNDLLSPDAAHGVLDDVSRARSWGGNQYVERARSLLADQ